MVDSIRDISLVFGEITKEENKTNIELISINKNISFQEASFEMINVVLKKIIDKNDNLSLEKLSESILNQKIKFADIFITYQVKIINKKEQKFPVLFFQRNKITKIDNELLNEIELKKLFKEMSSILIKVLGIEKIDILYS